MSLERAMEIVREQTQFYKDEAVRIQRTFGVRVCPHVLRECTEAGGEKKEWLAGEIAAVPVSERDYGNLPPYPPDVYVR